MSDNAPPPYPFDPPEQPLEAALAEQWDFRARLDAMERKHDVALERLATVSSKVSSLQVDVGRVGDVGTTNQLTLERVEKGIAEIRVSLRKLLGGK